MDAIATMTVVVPRSITGQELIEAVKRAAGDEQSQQEYTEVKYFYDTETLYSIGIISPYPYNNFRVSVNPEDYCWINPNANYSVIRVHSHEWTRQREVYAVGFGPEAVRDAAMRFRNRIEAELAKLE